MRRRGIRSLANKFTSLISSIFKSKSVEYIYVELRELENVFTLLVLGSFIGLPSPPTTISLRLLPYMAREIIVSTSISARIDDMLAEMAGIFEVT